MSIQDDDDGACLSRPWSTNNQVPHAAGGTKAMRRRHDKLRLMSAANHRDLLGPADEADGVDAMAVQTPSPSARRQAPSLLSHTMPFELETDDAPEPKRLMPLDEYGESGEEVGCGSDEDELCDSDDMCTGEEVLGTTPPAEGDGFGGDVSPYRGAPLRRANTSSRIFGFGSNGMTAASQLSFSFSGTSASGGFGGFSRSDAEEAARFRSQRSQQMRAHESAEAHSPQRVVKRKLSRQISRTLSLSESSDGIASTPPVREDFSTNSVLRSQEARPCPSPSFGSFEFSDSAPFAPPPSRPAPPRPLQRAQTQIRIGVMSRSSSCLPSVSAAHRLDAPCRFDGVLKTKTDSENNTAASTETSRTSDRVMRKKIRRADSVSYLRRPHGSSMSNLSTHDSNGHERYRAIMESYKSPVPILPKRETQHTKAIDGSELVKLLTGAYDSHFKEVVVVDCRWPYEYEGGHVRGAINLYTKDAVLDYFLARELPQFDQRTAVVFHCEFSQVRGPSRCKELTEADRKHNFSRYPEMFYPFLFLLEGGYRKFHANYSEYCNGGYREMTDKKHKDDLQMCNKLYRAKRKSSVSMLGPRPDRSNGRRRLASSAGGQLQDDNDMSPMQRGQLLTHSSDPSYDMAAICMRFQEEAAKNEREAMAELRGEGEGMGEVRPYSRTRSNASADMFGRPTTEEAAHGQLAYRFAPPCEPQDIGVQLDFSSPPSKASRVANNFASSPDSSHFLKKHARGKGGSSVHRSVSTSSPSPTKPPKSFFPANTRQSSLGLVGRRRSESHVQAAHRWNVHEDEGF